MLRTSHAMPACALVFSTSSGCTQAAASCPPRPPQSSSMATCSAGIGCTAPIRSGELCLWRGRVPSLSTLSPSTALGGVRARTSCQQSARRCRCQPCEYSSSSASCAAEAASRKLCWRERNPCSMCARCCRTGGIMCCGRCATEPCRAACARRHRACATALASSRAKTYLLGRWRRSTQSTRSALAASLELEFVIASAAAIGWLAVQGADLAPVAPGLGRRANVDRCRPVASHRRLARPSCQRPRYLRGDAGRRRHGGAAQEVL